MSLRTTDAQLHALMDAICQRYSYDFRDYSLPSQRRRLNQAIARFHCTDLPALQQLVPDDPAALELAERDAVTPI